MPSGHPARILLATSNPDKCRELRAILQKVWPETQVTALRDLNESVDLGTEEFATFRANAVDKAVRCARACGLPALGDDSGISVSALGGAPGVHSNRWAGTGATMADKIALLQSEIVRRHGPVPAPASMTCAVALARPDGSVTAVTRSIRGQILAEPGGRGNNGFGYDPVFFVPGLGKTLAEMTDEEKNTYSQRYRAVSVLLAQVPFQAQMC